MTKSDYESYADECMDSLTALQGKFKTDHDLTWYENWFYNQTTGLLTFSTDENQLNFKYFEVGTFSEKTKTWKWSWDNDHTLDKVKEKCLMVREFGKKHSFDKLTEGYFECEESDAWQFAAIATELTNGIAAYRPVSNHLKIFLVITEFVDEKEAQSIKDRYMQCGDHEYRRRAFVCQHLSSHSKTGFHETFDTYEEMPLEEDDDFEAWCDECEKVRLDSDGWNDESMEFAKIKVVCEVCYFDMKEYNIGTR